MDLTNIDDIHKLNELYVACNEALLSAQQDVQMQAQNMQNIRARIAELRKTSAPSKGKPASK